MASWLSRVSYSHATAMLVPVAVWYPGSPSSASLRAQQHHIHFVLNNNISIAVISMAAGSSSSSSTPSSSLSPIIHRHHRHVVIFISATLPSYSPLWCPAIGQVGHESCPTPAATNRHPTHMSHGSSHQPPPHTHESWEQPPTATCTDRRAYAFSTPSMAGGLISLIRFASRTINPTTLY